MAELTVEEKAALLDKMLQDQGVDPASDCNCPMHQALNASVAQMKQEAAKKKALAEGNRIEFVRIVREQIERNVEDPTLDERGKATGRTVLGMIAALEKGWEPVPELDPMTVVEDYTLPAYQALQESVLAFMTESFGE